LPKTARLFLESAHLLVNVIQVNLIVQICAIIKPTINHLSMKSFHPQTGLLIISITLLITASCKKKFDAETEAETQSSKSTARIASVASYLTDQSSINMYDIVYNYAGYWGNSAMYSEQNKQLGYTRLSEAAARGFKVIRFFAAGSYCETCVNLPVVQLWKTNPAAFFTAFDNLVADAGSLGIQLVPALVTGFSDQQELLDAYNYYGSSKNVIGSIAFMDSLTTNAGGVVQTFDCINNPGACKNRSEMRQFALDIVNRYKHSTTVLYWEIGNEINLIRKSRNVNVNLVTESAIRDYIVSLAADIKAVDNMHMLDAGLINEAGDQAENDYYFNYYYQNNPNIDIANVHLYEPGGVPVAYVEQAPAIVIKHFADMATALGKTLVIGETGVAGNKGWIDNNFNDYVMSLLLAKTYLKVPLAMAWTWQSKDNGYPNHPEMIAFSIDPNEDDDAISVLSQPTYFMGNNNIQTAYPITGDFNGDGYDDFGVKTVRGLFQLSLVNNFTATIPSQWLSKFGDETMDPGGSPFRPITGDWNGDGKTDIGLKAKDGRWFVSFSDPITGRFVNQAQWLSNFGNDNTDPGGAPFLPITGDWNGDGRTDIGLKSKDGRWFVAFSDPTTGQFVNQAQWISNFGNNNTDPGGAPFLPITGDWNGDGRTDIGLKSRDGRWFVAFSDPVTGQFVNQAQWLSNFGNDNTDPGGAPFLPITGDWNGDGRTDIGLKAKDGRWFVAFSDPTTGQFVNQAQWLLNMGNDYTDPGGAPFIPITGDWNNDGKTDIGLKSNDGRWFGALNGGSGFNFQKAYFE
jgi:hypothetical protein